MARSLLVTVYVLKWHAVSLKTVKVITMTGSIEIVEEEEVEDFFIQMIDVTTAVRLATMHTTVSCILVEVVVDRLIVAGEDLVLDRGRTEEVDARIPGVIPGREVAQEVVTALALRAEVTPGLAQEADRFQRGESPLEEDHAQDPQRVIDHAPGLQVEEDLDPKAGHLVKVMVNDNNSTICFEYNWYIFGTYINLNKAYK